MAWWHNTPLYLRIVGALVLGLLTGVILGPQAAGLRLLSTVILQLLRALATALIMVAVIHALSSEQIQGRSARRLVSLLVQNTLVAILIGLLVANLIQPGRWAELPSPSQVTDAEPFDPLQEFIGRLPSSALGPLVDNNIVAGIFIALAFGIGLRRVRWQQRQAGQTAFVAVDNVINTLFSTLMVVLHWIIDIIPFAVFGIVASLVGTQGFQPFISLGVFVLSVLLALLLQVIYYLTRVRLGSWVNPFQLLLGSRDALLTAFSTASSTATMPITYTNLRENIRLREESASMGALVGANFNNDGTALYEAMAALFIAQVVGISLSLPQQVIVVFMAIVASVGAPGIPEAGLVTMLLVFAAVGLPPEYVPLLLTVDWFLDRCRTAINVMGDMTVSCLLDGKQPEVQPIIGGTAQPEPV